MTTQKTVTTIVQNIRAHADEYAGALGEALHGLAQQITSPGDISPTVEKLFGPENGLYAGNPCRDEDLSRLFEEIGLPKSW